MQVRGVYVTDIPCVSNNCVSKGNFSVFFFPPMILRAPVNSTKDVSSVRIEIVGYCVVIRSTVMLVDPERKR